MSFGSFPKKQGLYDPSYEKDSCGVGFVCNIKGKKSYNLIDKALTVLEHMSHRGAVGADPETGDGAGILLQIPHKFYNNICMSKDVNLPDIGQYGTGLFFLPSYEKDRLFCENVILKAVRDQGQDILYFRDVPVNDSIIGKEAKKNQPIIKQIFIENKGNKQNNLFFERKLYIIRKTIENEIRSSSIKQKSFFYINSLSCRTIVYKGLLMPEQLREYYLDLKDNNLASSIALVHSRYSTNTFPTWDLAQPFRFIAHNGEINTLRGNINWMKAREGLLKSEIFGDNIEKLEPIITPDVSDSASIDNMFELLELSGRSLSHILMMLVPAAWQKKDAINDDLKSFYKYHACFMEPWDGPAAIAITDGTRIGAVLDRNGLRPARYIVTKDDMVVMASETGVLDIAGENILYSGRLEPGKVFFVDTSLGKIIEDKEIKEQISTQQPYKDWVDKNIIELENLNCNIKDETLIDETMLFTYLKSFGYSREDLKSIILPMVEEAKEPIGAMGSDIPHAILSKKPQLLYNYFKQLFAQVTNPAIDPIREELVMSLESFIGPEKNILEETAFHAHKLRVKNPLLTNHELQKIIQIKEKGFKTKIISILFNINDENDFCDSLERVCSEAVDAVKDGYTFIVLSDKGTNKDYSALPALLVVGAVHHRLIKETLRVKCGLILESAEPKEVHHFAVLFGYGVDCINPYLVYQTINYLVNSNSKSKLEVDVAINNYRNAVGKGLYKIFSKMGISTIQSYRGAQIFEIIGLNKEVVNKCFNGTTSRIEGLGFNEIRNERIIQHKKAYKNNANIGFSYLSSGGIYQWKKDGEYHLWNPETISILQDSVRRADYSKYKEFSYLINDQSKNPTSLRGLLKFKKRDAISIDKVESSENIVKRFVTGAMSFGSISKDAHETLAFAMNRLGGKSNTGEGG